MKKTTTTLLITSFKEPHTIGKAIECALDQETNHPYKILISAPDKETLTVAQQYAKKNQQITLFKDPGKGKSFALNILFKKIKSDILILTDGDVQLGKTAVEEILSLLEDPKIGCVTGRPIPLETRKKQFGYWAHFLFDAAHRLRSQAFNRKKFIECSGYLFAFRKKYITQIPLDVAEDTLIPYLFAQKGYQIGYAQKAEVYVKNVENWKDWIKQKTRTSKAHETLGKYVDIKKIPRVKSFGTEIKGIRYILSYPKSFKERYWTLLIIGARLYMWLKVFWDTRVKNKRYRDAWERVESTK